MKIINLYGGPGVGKSTLALGLSAYMKQQGLEVEFVSEYAKQLTWEKRSMALSNQVYVFAKQLHQIHRLADQVDYIVTDSPLLLTLAYKPESMHPSFDAMVIDVVKEYPSINLMLERHTDYNSNGRNQTLREAVDVDERIKTILDYYRVPYSTINPITFEPASIYDYLR